jgi:hypothetical protein
MLRSVSGVVVLLALVVAHLAKGAEIEIEGILKAVNIQERTLTVERRTAKGTKESSLEVDEQVGDLSSLKAGDGITVLYDSTLEVVTKIVRRAGNQSGESPSPSNTAPRESMAKSSGPNTKWGDEKLQEQYDALWKAYADTLETAVEEAKSELNRLYDEAKADGNLDVAILVRDLKIAFAENGTFPAGVADDSKGKKKDSEANVAGKLKRVALAFEAKVAESRKSLEEGYKALEVKATKAGELEQALAIRNEFKTLWGAASPSPVESTKPAVSANAEVIDLLKQIKLDETPGWRRTGGVLISGVLGKEKVVAPKVPVSVEGDYEIVAEIQLRNANEENSAVGFNMTLPMIAGSPRIAIVGKDGRATCFYFATASVGEKPPALTTPMPNGLMPNAWHEVLVRVRKGEGKITVVVNSKEVLESSPFKGFPASGVATVGIDTGLNQMMIRKWELRLSR